ncbi:MAG: type VI secretion system tip protein VgrG [Azoarcus sp.]|jgi:type VI secretion system secreted protein VgrG|nr:type VI secretion system tip protein VgrG [Azoarcus sp.]
MHRALIAHTPLGEKWWATSLTGTESLSSLYEFTLGLKSESPNIDCQAIIGEVAAVELEAQNGIRRYFSGQIVKALACGKKGGHWAYEVLLAPKLWHASRRADFKIWQNRSVREIANEVLGNNALRFDWRLKNQYKTWTYLVQYGETDLNFLSRLFEHEGIYYWFEHGTKGETLVLGDHFTTHMPFGGYETIPFYPPDQARADEDHYYGWRAARRPDPGRFQHSDYDFERPWKNLATRYEDPRGHWFDQYEIYAYPGDYIEEADGRHYAMARLDALQRKQDVTLLEGRVRGAIPGCTFTLRRHPRADQNRELLITRAAYTIENNEYEGAGHTGEGAHFHVNIETIPYGRQYCAPQKTPKPRTRGPETAVVVGPPGSEIHTDKYGRVKVHFHWDRYGQKDGKDSCWIRVAYPWAGTNFGGIHIPRVGQEVIVDYEHGDPDRPIITGRVYNAEQMPPWDLPANNTQSGILTRSSPKGTPDNANALRFEDAKGEEQVWLHAERNQDIEVEVDETHWVGQDRAKTIDRDETTVVHRHRTETVDGNETITVHQNRTEEVDGNESVTIHKNRSKTVDKNETDRIGKSWSTRVGRTKTETIGMAYMQNVGMGRLENVGLGYSLNVGLMMNTVVGVNQSTQVGNNITFTAGDSITLQVGKSVLVMKSDGTITLNGNDFTVTLTNEQVVKADGNIILKGAKILEN